MKGAEGLMGSFPGSGSGAGRQRTIDRVHKKTAPPSANEPKGARSFCSFRKTHASRWRSSQGVRVGLPSRMCFARTVNTASVSRVNTRAHAAR